MSKSSKSSSAGGAGGAAGKASLSGKAGADASADDGVVFVNEGLQRWEKMRAEWKADRPGKERRGEVCAKTIDVEDVIERIFSQSGKGILPEPIPLGQMIDILVDFWESEGLFD